ncbi:MAG: hypothetical protein ACYS9Y_14655, partial [Planctomycetota bacterium]
MIHHIQSNRGTFRIALALHFFFYGFVHGIYGSTAQETKNGGKLIITGSEFYHRSRFDTSEMRVFLKNIGNKPMSVNECELRRLLVENNVPQKTWTKINYLYTKLSPPVLMPGQNGELLIKLAEAPPNNSMVKCVFSDNTGNFLEVTILIKQTPVWVPYIGFSEDLSKLYVYIQNSSRQPLKAELLKVAGISASDNYQSINGQILPGDIGCLIFKMTVPFTLGEYVHVVISTASKDQEWKTERIIRTVNKFPITFEFSSDSDLGLDSERFFVTSTTPVKDVACIQNMVCPAHAYGTYENAAKVFLDKYHSVFLQNAHLLMQMWICRNDRPDAWYKFGSLPDIAVMNPILLAPKEYTLDTEVSPQLHPFSWLATMAKKATEPIRYFACIPLYPEKTVFLHSSYTSDDIKFLIYCAIASGAKGIVYRDRPASDQFSRNAFTRLNKELQQFKSLLMIAEPVNWASVTGNENYIAR